MYELNQNFICYFLPQPQPDLEEDEEVSFSLFEDAFFVVFFLFSILNLQKLMYELSVKAKCCFLLTLQERCNYARAKNKGYKLII